MATIRDVAAAAGVSPATVSRVLSGARPVGPEVATAVREASSRLGYRPHLVARALRRQSTQTVGMVVPDISNPYFPGIVQAVEGSLQAESYHLLLCDSENDPKVEAGRVAGLLERRIDGLLIIPCDTLASAGTVREAAGHVPVVAIDRLVAGAPVDHVGVDNAAGMRAAISHLKELGRNRLAFVGARSTMSAARERLEAFRRATAAPQDRVLIGEFSVEWGREAAARLAASGHLPDAVLAANDLIGFGLIDGLRGRGVRVPRDVSVVGFDDIMFAALCAPPLTTLRQPLDVIGRYATDLLVERLNGKADPPRKIRVSPELVVRASTAPMRAAGRTASTGRTRTSRQRPASTKPASEDAT